MMVVIAILVAVLLVLLISGYYGSRIYRYAALLAFSGHLFVSLILLPRLPYGWDIGAFHQAATEIATGATVSGSRTVSSFGAFQGLIYTLFTPQPETLAVFNGLMAILVAIPALYLTSRLYSHLPQNTPAVMLAILFLPLPFLFLSIPIRDTLTILLFFTLLAVIVRTLETGILIAGLPAIPLWGMIYLLRTELALIVILGTIAGSIIKFLRITNLDVSVSSLMVLFGTIGCLGFGLFAGLLYSFERVNAALKWRSRGSAVYLDQMEYQSWFDFLLAAPARGVYFQFTPFPLHVKSVFHLLAFLGALFVIVLWISAVRSLYKCEYDETTAVLLLVVYLTGIIGYGTINSNFGTNVRHRIVFDYLLIVFASPTLHQWWLYIRSWLGVAPSQCNDDNKQERETQEFDRGTHCGCQDATETQQ